MMVLHDMYRIKLDSVPDTALLISVRPESTSRLKVHLSFETMTALGMGEKNYQVLDGLLRAILTSYVPRLKPAAEIVISGDWFETYRV